LVLLVLVGLPGFFLWLIVSQGGRAAGWVGLSVHECREIEAGDRTPSLDT
jgi:hypothetical protein